MRKKISFKNGPEITISNEEDFDSSAWGISRIMENGSDFEDLTVEIKISDLCDLSIESLDALRNWLRNNAEMHIRADIQKRNEQEERQEKARQEKWKLSRAEEKEKKKNKIKEGYIYLIAADNGFHKIGKTINVTNRVNEFGVKLPMKTWLVHSFKSNQYDSAERVLHDQFSDKRSHGEWFNLTEEDVEYIKSIVDGQL